MSLPDWNLLVIKLSTLIHSLFTKQKCAKTMLLGNACSTYGLRIGTGPVLDRRGYGC